MKTQEEARFSLGNSKLRKTAAKIRTHRENGVFPSFLVGMQHLVFWLLHVSSFKRWRIASYNLPAYKARSGETVCVGAGGCADLCYAQQGRFRMPTHMQRREDELASVKAAYRDGGLAGAVYFLCKGLENLPSTVGFVRIHDSGDFFARWYALAWVEVALRNPKILFYAYTKSVPLFVRGNLYKQLPANFVLTFSEGGIWDDDIPENAARSRIFASEEDRIRAGYVDGNDSDIPAILGHKRIGLVYHGIRKPKVASLEAVGAYA